MKGQDKRISDIFYFSRVIAIIAVVAAHTPFHKCENKILMHIIDTFSCLGVAVFFFSAGYYFKGVGIKNRLSKMSCLLLPWVLLGSLGYFVNAISNGFSVFAYIRWVAGYGSYLWFMTMYVVLNVLFEVIQYIKKAKAKEILYVVLLLCTIASRVLMPIFDVSGEKAFLNLFNWIGFFALGQLLQEKKCVVLFEKKGAILRGGICLALLTIFFVLEIRLDGIVGYFGYTAVIEQFCWIGLIFSVGSLFDNIPKMVSYIGKNTLSIYLIHITPLQWVCGLFPIIAWLYIPLSVCFVAGLFLALWAFYLLARKCKLEKIYEKVFGFKI